MTLFIPYIVGSSSRIGACIEGYCIRSINTGKDSGESIFSVVFTSVYWTDSGYLNKKANMLIISDKWVWCNLVTIKNRLKKKYHFYDWRKSGRTGFILFCFKAFRLCTYFRTKSLKALEQDSLKAVLPLPIKMIRRHFIWIQMCSAV